MRYSRPAGCACMLRAGTPRAPGCFVVFRVAGGDCGRGGIALGGGLPGAGRNHVYVGIYI